MLQNCQKQFCVFLSAPLNPPVHVGRFLYIYICIYICIHIYIVFSVILVPLKICNMVLMNNILSFFWSDVSFSNNNLYIYIYCILCIYKQFCLIKSKWTTQSSHITIPIKTLSSFAKEQSCLLHVIFIYIYLYIYRRAPLYS